MREVDGPAIPGPLPYDVHHEPPRSLGGDGTRIVLLPHVEHMLRHQIGLKRYNELRNVDLEAIAAEVESKWQEECLKCES